MMFVTLVAVFMTCLVVGDLIGGKLTVIHVFGREWPFSVGQLAFPVTFILTDILNEFYGRKVVRRVTVLAFCMVGLAVGIIAIAGQLPWWGVTSTADWSGVTPREFDLVFSQAMWIQLSSMAAFLIGNLVDISLFFVLKRATGNRMLWLRATGSTAVSQLIDTVIITALVWRTKVTFDGYLALVFGSYAVKLAAAILVTPVIYALHGLIERLFKIEPAPLEPDEPGVPRATARDRQP